MSRLLLPSNCQQGFELWTYDQRQSAGILKIPCECCQSNRSEVEDLPGSTSSLLFFTSSATRCSWRSLFQPLNAPGPFSARNFVLCEPFLQSLGPNSQCQVSQSVSLSFSIFLFSTHRTLLHPLLGKLSTRHSLRSLLLTGPQCIVVYIGLASDQRLFTAGGILLTRVHGCSLTIQTPPQNGVSAPLVHYVGNRSRFQTQPVCQVRGRCDLRPSKDSEPLWCVSICLRTLLHSSRFTCYMYSGIALLLSCHTHVPSHAQQLCHRAQTHSWETF